MQGLLLAPLRTPSLHHEYHHVGPSTPSPVVVFCYPVCQNRELVPVSGSSDQVPLRISYPPLLQFILSETLLLAYRHSSLLLWLASWVSEHVLWSITLSHNTILPSAKLLKSHLPQEAFPNQLKG